MKMLQTTIASRSIYSFLGRPLYPGVSYLAKNIDSSRRRSFPLCLPHGTNHRSLCTTTTRLASLGSSRSAIKKQSVHRPPSSKPQTMDDMYEEHVETRRNVEMTLAELTDVLNQKAHDKICVVDVRDTAAVVKTGMIPNSINIPIANLKNVLPLTTEDFVAETQGTCKPTKDDAHSYFVFYGEGPNQAMTALEIAYRCGYKNSRIFGGGWRTWLSATEDSQSKEGK